MNVRKKIFKTKWYEIAEEEEKAEVKAEELPSWCKVGEVVYYNDSYYTIVEMNGQYEVKITDGVEDEWVKTSNVQEARLRPFNKSEMLKLLGKVVENKETKNVFLIHSVTDSKIGIGQVFIKKEVLLKSHTFIDGSPCGVYEHLENGEWVE